MLMVINALKWLAKSLAAVVLYGVALLLAILLLATAQIRSPSGTSYDTWRLNYRSNTIDDQTLNQDLVGSRKNLLKSTYDLNMAKTCLSLFDNNGTLQEKKLSVATKRKMAEVKEKGVDPTQLQEGGDFEAFYAVTGHMRLQSDINW